MEHVVQVVEDAFFCLENLQSCTKKLDSIMYKCTKKSWKSIMYKCIKNTKRLYGYGFFKKALAPSLFNQLNILPHVLHNSNFKTCQLMSGKVGKLPPRYHISQFSLFLFQNGSFNVFIFVYHHEILCLMFQNFPNFSENSWQSF